MPQCTFPLGGKPATGCAGTDVCYFLSYVQDRNEGVGYCFGGCQSDADCAKAGKGQHCQLDEGICLTAVTPAQPPGTACNLSTGSTCNCLSNATTGAGYCAPFCVVGGNPCPAGTVCDAFAGATPDPGGQSPGLGGYCAASCVGEAGACPAGSTCSFTDPAGPDCLP